MKHFYYLSIGYFWHARKVIDGVYDDSTPVAETLFTYGIEVNASAEKSGFEIMKSTTTPTAINPEDTTIHYGDFVQLYHKDLSSYLAAEGLFDLAVTAERMFDSDMYLLDTVVSIQR